MYTSNSPIPSLSEQSPTVDFIEQRLPHHHPIFRLGRPIHHESDAYNFAASHDEQALTLRPTMPIQQGRPSETYIQDNSVTTTLLPRPSWGDVNTMELWNALFPEALARLNETVVEPKDRANTNFSIRKGKDWAAIFSKLEQSKVVYQNEGGLVGRFTRGRRTAADNLASVNEAVGNLSKAIPDSMFSTPVTGALKVVLGVSTDSKPLFNSRNNIRHGLSDSLL